MLNLPPVPHPGRTWIQTETQSLPRGQALREQRPPTWPVPESARENSHQIYKESGGRGAFQETIDETQNFRAVLSEAKKDRCTPENNWGAPQPETARTPKLTS